MLEGRTMNEKREQFRAKRANDFQNQGATNAAGFNFDQYNRKDVKGTHVSGAEVKHMRQNYGLNENLAALQKQKDSGATFGKVAQRQYDNMTSRKENIDYKKQYTDHFKKIGKDEADTKMLIEDYERNTKGLDQAKAFEALEGGRQFDPKGGDAARYAEIQKRGEAKERAGNFQANSTDIKNTQTQTVTQDNDQTSNVTGDNNYVYQNQDNSVRNYGGDNRSFVYNSNGEGPDTPATMATLGGFYAPDDSPAAQAKRLDFHQTMNRDAQKKYGNTSHIAEGAIARADRNRGIDPNALDKRIAQRSQYHRDQSTIKGGQIFGDLFGMEGPTWNSAEPGKPVEKPDFEKMYDKYTDF